MVESNIVNISLFEDISEKEKQKYEKWLRWKNFDDGEQIIDRSGDNTDIIFVADGAVRVLVYSVSGKEVALDDVEAGGFLGELAAIDRQPRSATVIAVKRTKVGFMSADNFVKLVEEQPKISLRVMKRLSQIIRQSTGRIVDLSTLAANNRVHGEILRLAKAQGYQNNICRISPIPVHSDIASRVSTTRETVARVLGDLSRRNIVVREKNCLVVKDMEALETMVLEVRGTI
jgi:CRP-like cAMP-binding protein